jgi:tRNA(adenine34) deaminase
MQRFFRKSPVKKHTVHRRRAPRQKAFQKRRAEFPVFRARKLESFLVNETDEFWMRKALAEAGAAAARDEVPVGACLIDKDGRLLAAAGNLTISTSDPTAHAEILVIREAARKIGNYRLLETTLYTTIEPCVMCAGALVNARIKRLVYGAPDERFGAVASRFQICDGGSLNHRIEIEPGVLAGECRALMQEFFRARRNK